MAFHSVHVSVVFLPSIGAFFLPNIGLLLWRGLYKVQKVEIHWRFLVLKWTNVSLFLGQQAEVYCFPCTSECATRWLVFHFMLLSYAWDAEGSYQFFTVWIQENDCGTDVAFSSLSSSAKNVSALIPVLILPNSFKLENAMCVCVDWKDRSSCVSELGLKSQAD